MLFVVHENLIKSYLNLKETGTLYLTLTGCPWCLPGIHLGDMLITRRASASNKGCALLTIFASVTAPSVLIIN